MGLPRGFDVDTAGLEKCQLQVQEMATYYNRIEATKNAMYELLLIFHVKRHQWRMPPGYDFDGL
jgi:hypothetical protein